MCQRLNTKYVMLSDKLVVKPQYQRRSFVFILHQRIKYNSRLDIKESSWFIAKTLFQWLFTPYSLV